jgi:hypothetical protein
VVRTVGKFLGVGGVRLGLLPNVGRLISNEINVIRDQSAKNQGTCPLTLLSGSPDLVRPSCSVGLYFSEEPPTSEPVLSGSVEETRNYISLPVPLAAFASSRPSFD